jgi:hypothetical protein
VLIFPLGGLVLLQRGARSPSAVEPAPAV